MWSLRRACHSRETPGCAQATSLATGYWRDGVAVDQPTSRRSRNSVISSSPSHSGRDCQEPSAAMPPSVVSARTCGCR